MRLDHLDARIVSLLREDARLSFRELAERLGSTTPTVSARVKALEDVGLLRGYRAEIDPSIFGGTSYIVTLTVQPAAARGALAALRAMPAIQSVHLLAGGRLVARAHLRPPEFALAHLHEAIAALPAVITYDASEVLEGHEQPAATELPENVDVPCHQCRGPIHGDPVKGKFGARTHVFCCRQCLGTFRERYEALARGAASPKPAPGTPPIRAERRGSHSR